MKYIGIDIGGTNFKLGILDENLNIIFKKSRPADAHLGIRNLIDNIRNDVRISLNRYKDCVSIGVGIPGITGDDGTVKVAPNLPGSKDLPLGELLRSEFSIPIAIDNDSNTAALAEMELGAGRGENNFIYITLGTGVGGTIVHCGKIFRGSSGGAGEIGYLIIDANKERKSEPVYKTGIFEEFIGRNHIAETAQDVLMRYPNSPLRFHDIPDPYYISKAAEENDTAAIEIFKKIGYYLGVGIASAMNFLDIKIAIIGGGLSQAHEILFETARNTISQRAIPTVAESFEIRRARFTRDAGIIGASLLGRNLYNERNIDR